MSTPAAPAKLSLAQFLDAYRAQAAAAQTVAYPVNPALPRFNSVPICAVGENYTPGGWILDGGRYSPDAPYLQGFADVYDPFFCCMTLDLGHPPYYERRYHPALALGLNLEFSAGLLRVDLVNVEPFLADEIEAGRWPNRSKEWDDASNYHAWAQWLASPGETVPGEEEFYFYGKHHHYVHGLSLLSVLPAVHSLGPMPPRASAGGETESQQDGPALPEYLLAAARKPVTIHRLAASHGASRFTTQLIPHQEAEMPDLIPAPTGAQPGGGAAAGKPETQPPDTNAAVKPADTITAAEAAQIRADNARLTASMRERDVKDALSAHLASGRLTTQAQREAYTALLSQLHGQPAPEACQASQVTEVAGAASAAQLLDVIINGFPPQVPLGAAAAHATGSDRNPAAEDPTAKARREAIEAATAARKEGRR